MKDIRARAEKRAAAIAALNAAGIAVTSRSEHLPLTITHNGSTYDYWPCAESWRNRANCQMGKGVKSLIKALSKP